MTPDEVKEYINHALASSRGLTSDLASDIIRKMKDEIAKSVDTTVNGKIKAIDTKIDVYIREDNEYKQRTEKETEKWRMQADSKLELVANIQGFSKVAFKVLGFIVATGGAVAVLLKWFHDK